MKRICIDASHCIEVFQKAIAIYGAPESINSDRGILFTCEVGIEACAKHPQMKVSMYDLGRTKDHIWIERFGK